MIENGTPGQFADEETGDADRGQWRVTLARIIGIIETYDGNVGRHAKPMLGEYLHTAGRVFVVYVEYARRKGSTIRMGRDERTRRDISAAEMNLGFQTGCLHRLAVPGDAELRVVVALIATDQGYPCVSMTQKMLDTGARSVRIVHSHTAGALGRVFAGEENAGQALLLRFSYDGIMVPGTHDNYAVRSQSRIME